MTKSLYPTLLKNSNLPYDSDEVNRHLIRIKRMESERLRNKYKEELFFLLAKIVLKAVNNFFFITRDINKEKILHTKEDICSECFLIMDKCIQNLKIVSVKKFYFYFNTSLNRGIYRLYEKHYKKHFDVLDNSEKTDSLIQQKKYTHHFDLCGVDLKHFSEIELELIAFKISGEKLDFFLKKAKIPNSQYYVVLESVIAKLQDLYGKEEHLEKFFIKK